MLITFNFTRIALVVRRWFEITPDAAMEHGARVELHVLTPQPHRGTDSAAQKTVIDGAFWRADLFNRFGHPAASFSAAHYHPSLDGIEPSDRVWSTDLTADPWTWLTKWEYCLGQLGELADVRRLIEYRHQRCRQPSARAAPGRGLRGVEHTAHQGGGQRRRQVGAFLGMRVQGVGGGHEGHRVELRQSVGELGGAQGAVVAVEDAAPRRGHRLGVGGHAQLEAASRPLQALPRDREALSSMPSTAVARRVRLAGSP